MHKLIQRWNALPAHQQAASILVGLGLAFSLYSSIVTVVVWPVIQQIQQGSGNESQKKD